MNTDTPERAADFAAEYGADYLLYFLGLNSNAAGSQRLVNGMVAIAFYGVGMALVVTALTVTLAVAETGLLRFLRAGTRYLETISAVVVLLSGIYLSWYWVQHDPRRAPE